MKERQMRKERKRERTKKRKKENNEERNAKEKPLFSVLSANHNFLPILDGKLYFLSATGNPNKNLRKKNV